MKKIALMIPVALLLMAGQCSPDAQVASKNLSTAADMFEIQRRVVFYNGITGEYMLVVEGRCSIESSSGSLKVTCKEGPNKYVKHFLGLSDNISYFAEQTELADVSVYHNRIVWKPQSVIPDIDLNIDAGELMNDRN
jgi:hypothetical protein